MFVQYITQQGHNVVRSERKPRKNLQYKDMGMEVMPLARAHTKTST